MTPKRTMRFGSELKNSANEALSIAKGTMLPAGVTGLVYALSCFNAKSVSIHPIDGYDASFLGGLTYSHVAIV